MIQNNDVGYGAIDEPDIHNHRRKCRLSGSFARFLGASVAILAAIISWVIMAEKLQRVTKVYRKPFFITYWVHGFGYSFLYFVWQIWLILPGNVKCIRVGEGAWKGRSKQLIILSCFLAIVSFSSAYSWYYSLARTNIPANTAIYQSACVWVFILSIFLLKERITVLKILAVIISVVGVVLVAVFSNTGSCSKDMTELNNSTSINTSAVIYYSGENNMLGHIHRGSSCTEKSTFPGYIALFFSVISYAVFEVSYNKWGTQEHDPASVQNSIRVLGYIGLHTLIWLWPCFIILHFTGIERFEFPPYDIFILLLWNAYLDIFFNAGLLICIALSSALFASVGTILVIPVAILVDWMLQGFLLKTGAAIGVAIIIMGFIAFIASEIIALKIKDKDVRNVNHRPLEQTHTSSVCQYKDNDGLSEEGEGNTEETASLLRSRRKKNLILKYLF